MIVVLEGINGTGKSTVAKLLAAALDCPVWRPFRPNPDTHLNHANSQWSCEDAAKLREYGVPINTFVDDVFVADALRTLRPPHVILDRSMPSAVVYSRLDKEEWVRKAGAIDFIWDYWERTLMDAGPVMWSHFTAPYELTKERCEGRWHPNKTEWKQLKAGFDKLFQRSKFNKRMTHNVALKSPEEVAKRILAQVR